MADALAEPARAGVSIRLDDLSRARLAEGSLAQLMRNGHVVGVTTNPTIFAKAIGGSGHYDRRIRELATQDVDVATALRWTTTRDVAWVTSADPGIDDDDVMHTLEHDDLTAFRKSWAALADTLRDEIAAAGRGGREDDSS